MHSIGNWLP